MANQIIDVAVKTTVDPAKGNEQPNEELSLQKDLSTNEKTPIDENHYDSPQEESKERTALSIDFTTADLTNDYYEEPITFPQSTHSLLFTEPVCSIPFLFSVFIVVLSLVSLSLAMAVNNLIMSTIFIALRIDIEDKWESDLTNLSALVLN